MRSPACCSGEQEQEEGIEEAQGPSLVDGWPESSAAAKPEGGQAILADPRLGRRGRPGRQRHRCGLAYSAYAASTPASAGSRSPQSPSAVASTPAAAAVPATGQTIDGIRCDQS